MKHILNQLIDINAILASFQDDAAGAVVMFNGTVRKHNLGKAVSHLFYESAEEIADHMMSDILKTAQDKWKLTTIFAAHRVGEVRIGESAVLVITASAHRNEAYEANRFIIEKIKHELPIWKCEYFKDGTKMWGGNCSCQQITGDPNKHIYEL